LGGLSRLSRYISGEVTQPFERLVFAPLVGGHGPACLILRVSVGSITEGFRRVLDTSHDSYSDWWAVLDSVQIRSAYNVRAICRPTCAESVHSEEIDTPIRRTPFRSGNCAASNSALIDANVERSEIGATSDRLRVMI
jgi:hypothetical protein